MSELANYLKEWMKGVVEAFGKDIEALSHENLDKTWGESTRSGYDYAYEVALINRRVGCRLRGEDPGPMPWDFGKEWLKAPAEYRSKQKVIEFLNLTGDEVLNSIGDDPERQVKVGDEMQTVYQIVFFATSHTAYHDAQLNFIQEMTGDMAVHW